MKWPNDLYVGRRKLAGILAEATGSGGADAVVLGYGINVAPMAYPPELRDSRDIARIRARAACGSRAAVRRVAGRLWRGATTTCSHGRFDAILDAWRARAPASIGARVTWTTASGASVGVTAGIDDEGALLVRVGDRVERVIAGEVTWL